MQRVLQVKSNCEFCDIFESRFNVKKQCGKYFSSLIIEFEDFDQFNKSLCDYILQSFVEPYINNTIVFENNCFNSQEKLLIYSEVVECLPYEELENTIKQITCANSIICPEGIFNFRLTEILLEIKELCAVVSDKYIMKNEYLDFIRMLRFFASVNAGGAELINVIMKSNENADIVDNDFNVLSFAENSHNCEFAYAGRVYEYDSVISTLVEISPNTIVLHNWKNYKNSMLIETLINIFEDKVKFCHGCRCCTEG